MKMAHQKEYGTINNASVHHGVKPRGATSIDNSAPQAANHRATSSRVASHSAAGEISDIEASLGGLVKVLGGLSRELFSV